MNTFLAYVAVAVAVLACVTAAPKGQCEYSGEYLADDSNCQMFYICSDALSPQPQFCGGSLCWNEEAGYCDYSYNVYCCSPTGSTEPPKPTTTTPPPTTTTKTTTTTTTTKTTVTNTVTAAAP